MIKVKKIIAYPPLYISFSWILVAGLYSLRALEVQIFSAMDAFRVAFAVIVSFSAAFFLVSPPWLATQTHFFLEDKQMEGVEVKVKFLSLTFFAIAISEILIEGSLPLITLLRTGIDTHLSWGIPSIHGFVLGFGAFVATACYLVQKTRPQIWCWPVIIGVFVYFFAVMTRKMIMVTAIQIFLTYIFLFPKRAIKVIPLSVLIVFLFGAIGDLRHGGSEFIRSLVSSREEWVADVPSVLLWFYIYLVTPINNLINGYVNFSGSSEETIFSSFAGLIPSVLRSAFDWRHPPQDSFSYYWQVSVHFNVSTAYIYPVLSGGLWGLIVYNSFIGVSMGFVHRFFFGLGGLISVIILAQCVILSIFSSNYTNLNNVFQIAYVAALYFRFPEISWRGLRLR